MKRYLTVPAQLRNYVRSKIDGSQKVLELRHLWEEHVQANRVAARRQAYDLGGGHKASIISYGLQKARQKR